MPDSDNNQGLRYAGLGIEFAAAVAGLTLVGYWIDRHFGSSPWGVLGGAAIGLIGGTYNMIREALSANRRPPSPPKDGLPKVEISKPESERARSDES